MQATLKRQSSGIIHAFVLSFLREQFICEDCDEGGGGGEGRASYSKNFKQQMTEEGNL